MCGISGFLDWSRSEASDNLRLMATRMSEALSHRGPDDSGVWTEASSGIALSMRRLAILDLSPSGHQPMASESGRYVIVFNGEIYNYESLREELASGRGYRFRGHSDTEVMLAAFDTWGIEPSLTRLNGMFAFAVWDRENKSLTLARDRFGEKPLYYSHAGRYFLFGSELKALRVHPAFGSEIAPGVLSLYLHNSCIPAPYSIYKNTYKLPPASFLCITADDPHPEPQHYWSLHDVVASAQANPFTGTAESAMEQLDTLLRDAVKIRMRSDVPLGAFLSGGIDSSTVVALMQAQSERRVRTFCIGNHDQEFDEAREAASVARHLGTDHTEVYVSPQEALQVIPSLASIYDEPFADSSQIPTILVSRIAREQVTVALSGDGGDELFGGYTRHIWGNSLHRSLSRTPLLLRRAAAGSIRSVSATAWDKVFQIARPVVPSRLQQRMPGYKLHKLASILASKDTRSLYKGLSSRWLNISALYDEGSLKQPSDAVRVKHASEEMMYLDTVGYLPNDILVKLDRATMSVSLEGRAPLLDHRLAEFAWRLPLDMRIREKQGKWILRQVLYKYVPQGLVDRPKSGFGVPLGRWLRNDLRDWAESLLDERHLREGGHFIPATIRRLWHEHLSGVRNWEYQLWDVLIFQAWLDENSRAPHAETSQRNEVAGA